MNLERNFLGKPDMALKWYFQLDDLDWAGKPGGSGQSSKVHHIVMPGDTQIGSSGGDLGSLRCANKGWGLFAEVLSIFVISVVIVLHRTLMGFTVIVHHHCRCPLSLLASLLLLPFVTVVVVSSLFPSVFIISVVIFSSKPND